MLKKSWLHVKRQWLPYLLAYSAKMALRIVMKTCRIKIHGLQTFVETAKKQPCILMLWHNRLVLVSEILNSHASQFIYTAFISKSRDGDPLAILAESYSAGRALRVPHNARHLALGQLIGALKNKGEIIVITPDGPRGPAGVIKPGIVMAAREAEASVVPFSWQAKKFWQLKTWDRMQIPKPFTTIEVVFGEPVNVPKEPGVGHDSETTLLKHALDNLD